MMNELSNKIVEALYAARLLDECDLRWAMRLVDEVLSNPTPPNKDFEFDE